ncbi:hypothetical protein BX600DRAFT_476297 [Xylariales sp. PMI_506]|nr:hypothetical protein BX600DRAFT_476297 [Xylariales sp. PMI_506]
MKITPLWAAIALLQVPAVLAQATGTTTASSSTTSAAPTCTASLITSLCSYTEPDEEFAVAIDSRASCWDYCNDHQPCSFVIFVAGNPSTGTGTCWLYPGESFDASQGSSDCGSPGLFVYSQPVCAGGSATTTSGACAATASPSAIASVCGYPAPPGDCFDGCAAEESVTGCLSQCAQADSCSYVVYNPENPDNTPYSSGNCWMYPNGTYDAGAATTCSGAPEQYVYNNVCPKPSPASNSLSSTAASATGTGTGTGTATGAGTGTAGATAGSTSSSKNLAPTPLSIPTPLAIGMAILVWQGLQ